MAQMMRAARMPRMIQVDVDIAIVPLVRGGEIG
jgi:hypothetical protein